MSNHASATRSVDIAFFLMDLSGGGAEKVMLNLAEGFAAKGYSVDLILVQTKGEYLEQLSSKLKLVDLRCDRLIRSLPKLIKYLRVNQPKNIISALEDTNIIAISARLLSGIKSNLIVTVHNNLSKEADQSGQLKRRLVTYLLRWIYPYASAIVGVSNGVTQNLEELGIPSHLIHRIYNPIVIPDLTHSQISLMPDKEWFEQKHPVILGVGRLSIQKDFECLIRSFAKVRSYGINARLIILGEGEERAKLENCIDQLNLTQYVSLSGFVANPYIYMKQASLLVLSSAWEGFGNVLVEAMAVGTPVVSTHCKSGPDEILSQGIYGRLVEVGNVNSMAEAIQLTLLELPNRKLLEDRSIEFSLDNTLRQYETLLVELNT
jgi:glycosyltransferase involved in cell wall biosynthesis